MIVLDSSAWIEYLEDRPQAAAFHDLLSSPAEILVPSIVLHEVVRYATRSHGRDAANRIASQIERCVIAPLDARLACLSAQLGVRHSLPLADSIVYATAVVNDAKLHTMDADFKGLPGVKYLPKK